MAQLKAKHPFNWDFLYDSTQMYGGLVLEFLAWLVGIAVGMMLAEHMRANPGDNALVGSVVIWTVVWAFIITRVVVWLLQAGLSWTVCFFEAWISPDEGEEVIGNGEKEVPQEKHQPLDAQNAT